MAAPALNSMKGIANSVLVPGFNDNAKVVMANKYTTDKPVKNKVILFIIFLV